MDPDIGRLEYIDSSFKFYVHPFTSAFYKQVLRSEYDFTVIIIHTEIQTDTNELHYNIFRILYNTL